MRICVDCKVAKPLTEYYERHYTCKPCTKIRNRAYYAANRERVKAQVAGYVKRNREKTRLSSSRANKTRYQRLRQAALDFYGRVCACCGEGEELFLCIDHIDNDGREHRKRIKHMTFGIYNWLDKNDYPSGFQTLCQNCNWAKYTNGGTCPHNDPEGSTTRAEARSAKWREARSPLKEGEDIVSSV